MSYWLRGLDHNRDVYTNSIRNSIRNSMAHICMYESILTHTCRSIISINRCSMIYSTRLNVTRWWKMFGIIITIIFLARSPVYKELILVGTVTDPKNHISILRDLFFLTLSFTIPQPAEFSVLIWVGGWGWPSSMRVVQIGTAH